ncbi:SIS domain-containing protein [Methylomonas paludis]|uniref:Phosphoheptose isomerase n=1 Tax=Methylomonas paludis TaxID=1173101 RepID=A0A975R993_9GAMM|nr:SIS domain-containing protein [Methylomonas paludis]QWF70038.1 SIS domain-containing protein [Methylomonas paludis]
MHNDSNVGSIEAIQKLYRDGFEEHTQTHTATTINCITPLVKLTQICIDALNQGNKILFAGNGGSAADAQHLATELTIRFEINRPAIAAIALTTDTSTITAAANDFGFNLIFSRQVEALGKPGDVFIGITTSGKSPNILTAFEQARKMGITCVAFTGSAGAQLQDVVDVLIMVPSTNTARVQEEHILLGHLLCKGLEQNISAKRD